MKKQNKKIVLKLIISSLIILTILFIGGFVYTSLLIGDQVKQYCQISRKKYSQNSCVDLLISFLEDDKNSLEDKNHIIWALGQLGNKKALPVLQKYLNGQKCDHDQYLCQYELNKAINLINSNFNATAIFWRYNID